MKIEVKNNEPELTDILGYEGLYSISRCGTKITNKRTGYILSQNPRGSFFRVCLVKNKERKTHFVHVLVWESFHKKRKNDGFIRHIDDCFDNNLENLELSTEKALRSQNKKMYIGSEYTGVTPANGGKFFSQISIKGKTRSLGRFKTKIEAAKAYDKAVIEMGLSRPLNFKETA